MCYGPRFSPLAARVGLPLGLPSPNCPSHDYLPSPQLQCGTWTPMIVLLESCWHRNHVNVHPDRTLGSKSKRLELDFGIHSARFLHFHSKDWRPDCGQVT